MVCNTCGHSNDAHQYATSSLFYCDQCKSLESHISFSPEPPSPPKPGDISSLFK